MEARTAQKGRRSKGSITDVVVVVFVDCDIPRTLAATASFVVQFAEFGKVLFLYCRNERTNERVGFIDWIGWKLRESQSAWGGKENKQTNTS